MIFIPNIDSFFGKILKVEVFPKPKKELINNNKDKKIEIAPESKKLNFKKINKDLSPPQKSKEISAVGRNSSYYNCFNFPLIKNTNQLNKRKNLQLSNGKELKKNTQSFREKNIFAKSKNMKVFLLKGKWKEKEYIHLKTEVNGKDLVLKAKKKEKEC